MNDQNTKPSDFNTTNFLLFLWKWKLPLIIIVAAAAVVSAGCSFLITPMYKSTVVMFPTSTNAISKVLLADNFGGKEDILAFGEEEQAEQMLQILYSNDIRVSVIRKFNLIEHYNIDSNDRFRMTKLYEEYNSNITFRRTEFMAVEITVMDKDPQMAADIANTISDLLDSVKNHMQKERALMAFNIVEAQYLDLQRGINKLEDSLTLLRKLGINDYETQAEAYNVQLALELARGNKVGVNALEEKLKLLGEHGGAYVSLRTQLEWEKKQISFIKGKYEEARVDYEGFLPAKFIVDKAFRAEKKSYPVRWIIVVISTLASFILAIFTLLVIETFIKKKITLIRTEVLPKSA